jgi:ABC-type nitrate/sulfonate/bicarbonate transport system permease component
LFIKIRRYAMVEKIMLSDKEYEYLTKGIAIGVGIGIVSGMVLEDIVLGFSAGGVIGIIVSFVYSYYKRLKKHKK